MRGGAPAVEQARSCDQSNSGANASDLGAALVPAMQPWHHGCIAFYHVFNAEARGRDIDQICLADIFERHVRLDLDWPVTVDRTPIRRGRGHTEVRRWSRSGKDVPKVAGVA